MFNNMTIKSRLILVIGTLSILLAMVGGLGLYGIDQSNSNLKTVYEDRTIVLSDLGTILDRMHRSRFYADAAVNSKDIGVVKQRTAVISKGDAEIDATWQKFMATALVPEEEKLANTFSQQWSTYKQTRDAAMNLAIAGNFDAAAAVAIEDFFIKSLRFKFTPAMAFQFLFIDDGCFFLLWNVQFPVKRVLL